MTEWANHEEGEVIQRLTYFFGYKTEVFPVKNYLKNLDPSYKMDLGLCNNFGREEGFIYLG